MSLLNKMGIGLLLMYAIIMAHNTIPHCHSDGHTVHSHEHEHTHDHDQFWLSFLFDHHGHQEEDETHLEELQPSVDFELKSSAPYTAPILPKQSPTAIQNFYLIGASQYKSIFAFSFQANSPPPLLSYGLRAPPATVNT